MLSLESFDADELIALAKYDVEKGELDKALFKLKNVLSRRKAPQEAKALTARLYAQLGLFDKAKTLYKDYIKDVPDAELETFQLAMTHYDTGEIQQALDIWNQILGKQPTHPPSLFYSSLALANMGNKADAVKNLEKIMHSVASDNLYFERAKELMAALNSDTSGQVRNTTVNNPYLKQ